MRFWIFYLLFSKKNKSVLSVSYLRRSATAKAKQHNISAEPHLLMYSPHTQTSTNRLCLHIFYLHTKAYRISHKITRGKVGNIFPYLLLLYKMLESKKKVSTFAFYRIIKTKINPFIIIRHFQTKRDISIFIQLKTLDNKNFAEK